MITNTNTSLTLLNVGIACHQADWNWHNVRSPFARIYYVVEGHAEILLSNKKLELTAGRLYLIPPFTTLMKKVKTCLHWRMVPTRNGALHDVINIADSSLLLW